MARSSLLRGAAFAAVMVALCVLPGCGGSGSDDGPLQIHSDNKEKGDPELGSGRIRITPEGLWTPIFWVALEDLEPGQRVAARVNAQLTNCRPSDRAASSKSTCKGTAPYNFAAEIDSKLILAKPEESDSSRPQTSGQEIGSPARVNCTPALHHCVPVAEGEVEVTKADEGDRYVAFLVKATSPRARPCKPAEPSKCDVLQLTSGQGRLGVVHVMDPSDVPKPEPIATEHELARALELARSSGEKEQEREVVYSIQLDKPGPLVVDGLLQASYDAEGQPIPPLVSKELVLATSPKAIDGRLVAPQNGENCSGSCEFEQPAVVPCVTQEDLDDGYRYLNFVAFSARESAFAKGSGPVKVDDGGYLRAGRYDPSIAPDC